MKWSSCCISNTGRRLSAQRRARNCSWMQQVLDVNVFLQAVYASVNNEFLSQAAELSQITSLLNHWFVLIRAPIADRWSSRIVSTGRPRTWLQRKFTAKPLQLWKHGTKNKSITAALLPVCFSLWLSEGHGPYKRLSPSSRTTTVFICPPASWFICRPPRSACPPLPL